MEERIAQREAKIVLNQTKNRFQTLLTLLFRVATSHSERLLGPVNNLRFRRMHFIQTQSLQIQQDQSRVVQIRPS